MAGRPAARTARPPELPPGYSGWRADIGWLILFLAYPALALALLVTWGITQKFAIGIMLLYFALPVLLPAILVGHLLINRDRKQLREAQGQSYDDTRPMGMAEPR